MIKGTRMYVRKYNPLALIAIFFMAFGSAPARAAAPPRNLIVWTMVSGNIYGNTTNQTTLFNFLAAPKGNAANKITEIFCAGMLLSDFGNSTSISEMQSFNSAAHSHGITVNYLCGDPTWVTTNQSVALQYIDAVLNYNSTATSAQKFDGFMYDVEPWTLQGGLTSSVQAGWLQMLTNADNAVTSSKQALPLWQTLWWQLDSNKYYPLGNEVIDRINNGWLMDYTVNLTNFETFSSKQISYASSVGKGISIGVETNGPASTSTWYSYGNAAMENCLSTDLSFFQGYTAFLGYGVDDYAGYYNLIP